MHIKFYQIQKVVKNIWTVINIKKHINTKEEINEDVVERIENKYKL